MSAIKIGGSKISSYILVGNEVSNFSIAEECVILLTSVRLLKSGGSKVGSYNLVGNADSNTFEKEYQLVTRIGEVGTTLA
jgi:hypothetical protein